MQKLAKLSIGLFFIMCSCHKPITGNQLLEKAIYYHDPNQNWISFNGELKVTMESPNKSNRYSTIIINLPNENFYIKATRDTLITEYTIEKDSCKITFNGKTNLKQEDLKTNNLSCDRANLFKNYYTYLYGLPMKLKDKGTLIDNEIERKTFKGKDYLVLKATYDETVGSDVWYFYFHPETYAMEVYQFYKTDETGKIKPESGEYILLTETTVINAIKMPKHRAWYYNKNDTYLGTDILN